MKILVSVNFLLIIPESNSDINEFKRYKNEITLYSNECRNDFMSQDMTAMAPTDALVKDMKEKFII